MAAETGTKVVSSHIHLSSKLLGRDEVWTKCCVLENSLHIKKLYLE